MPTPFAIMTDLDEPSRDPVNVAIESLGTPDSVHRVTGRQVQIKMALGTGLIVLGILINGLWYTVGPAKFGHAFSHFLFLPLAFGIGLIGQVIWHRGVTVYTYPDGLIRLGRGKVETFLWDEIVTVRVRTDSPFVCGEWTPEGNWRAVWLTGKTPMVRLWHSWIEIVRSDGITLKLSPLIEDYERLGERIQRETFARIWPNVIRSLEAGEPVSFGTWTATADGLIVGKTTIPWAEVKKAELKGKQIVLGATSIWKFAKSTEFATLNNVHVLIALLADRIAVPIPIQVIDTTPPSEEGGEEAP